MVSLQKYIRSVILGSNTYIRSHSDFKQIMLSGHFALIGIGAMAVYLLMPFEKSWPEKLTFALAIPALAGTIRAHRKGRHMAANCILLTSLNLVTYVFAASESIRSGAFIFFLVNIIAAFCLFNYTHRKSARTFAMFSLFLFGLAYAGPFTILPFRHYADDALSVMASINAAIAVISSVLGISLLIHLNHYNTVQLDANNELLIKANSELDRFVYSTSHDLRAPLTSILGLINIAGNSQDLAEVQRYVGMMRGRVMSLDSFIKDITDYSRNNRREVGKEKFKLRDLAEEIWEELKFAPEAASISFDNQIPECLEEWSDRSRLKVVLSNLISNSIRYHDCRKASQFIRLCYNKSHHGFMLTVEDNGQGIAPEYHGKIFDMFYRANESSKGSGLGLYIVKETLAKLAGSISLQSRPGAGASFTIAVPCS